jgi:hypothetical protein
MEGVDNQMPIQNTKIIRKGFDCIDWVMFSIMVVIKLLYQLFYFHFMPFLGLFYCFYIADYPNFRTQECQEGGC